MTPTLLALSHAYLALPGAPVATSRDDCHEVLTPRGDVAYRDASGLLWVADPEHMPTSDPHDLGLVLDFRDAATGGVMLERMPLFPNVLRHARTWEYSVAPFGVATDPTGPEWSATLAEAVARAAVALGRAG